MTQSLQRLGVGLLETAVEVEQEQAITQRIGLDRERASSFTDAAEGLRRPCINAR